MLKIFSRFLRLFCGVDIGDDGFHRLREGGVGLHLLFHLFDGVEDGGVVPAAKFQSRFAQGEAGHPADQVHGDLAGVDTVP